VVAVWVFVSLAAAANAGAGDLGYRESTSTYYVDDVVVPGPMQITPTTVVEGSATTPPAVDGWVLVRPGPPGVVFRGTPVVPTSLPEGIQGDLAAAGLETVGAEWGSYTGPCRVCPNGWVPSVVVLSSLEGLGLPEPTQDLLRQGFAVTSQPITVPGQATAASVEVGGVPVVQGMQPLPVDVVVPEEALPEGFALSSPAPALVGSSASMSDEQVERVVAMADADGIDLRASDPRIDVARSTLDQRDLRDEQDSGASTITLWGSFLVLLLVTLAATATHRREHREAARLLHVLGGAPSSARRWSALSSAVISTTGVLLGAAAAAVAVVVPLGGSMSVDLVDVLWSAPVLSVLAVVAAVPPVASLIGYLFPPPGTGINPMELAPA
jgi:hypothetical protein